MSSREVVEAHLEGILELNPALNAVVSFVPERAMEEAHSADDALAKGEPTGRLHGVPSTGGALGRATFVPEADATVVRRVRNAGRILMGKTNTPEFTLAYETTEPHGFMIDLEELLARFALGSAAEIDALIAQWQTFNIGMLGFMQNHDLIICTVTPTQAVLRGTTFDDDVLPRFSYTAAFNVTGWLSCAQDPHNKGCPLESSALQDRGPSTPLWLERASSNQNSVGSSVLTCRDTPFGGCEHPSVGSATLCIVSSCSCAEHDNSDVDEGTDRESENDQERPRPLWHVGNIMGHQVPERDTSNDHEHECQRQPRSEIHIYHSLMNEPSARIRSPRHHHSVAAQTAP